MIRDIEEGKASRRFMLARLDIKKEQIHDIILKMDIIKLRMDNIFVIEKDVAVLNSNMDYIKSDLLSIKSDIGEIKNLIILQNQ